MNCYSKKERCTKATALAAGHLTLDALTVRRPQSQVVPEKLHDERRVLQFQKSHTKPPSMLNERIIATIFLSSSKNYVS